MRRLRNPFAGDLTDIVMIGAIGVAIYFGVKYLLPQGAIAATNEAMGGPDFGTNPATANDPTWSTY